MQSTPSGGNQGRYNKDRNVNNYEHENPSNENGSNDDCPS